MNKKILPFIQALFIALNAVSGVYYSPLFIGQWKAWVGLFGMVTTLFVLVAVIVFVISVVKRRNSTFLSVLCGIFCVMQFFPMVEAFMLGGAYFRNAIYHIFVLSVGILAVWLFAKIKKQNLFEAKNAGERGNVSPAL